MKENYDAMIAHYEIALKFEREKNFSEAVKHFTLAADSGYGLAQYELGVCYEKGLGVEKDYAEAVKYYTLAAEQGVLAAMLELAGLYEIGIGVERDLDKANYWHEQYKK